MISVRKLEASEDIYLLCRSVLLVNACTGYMCAYIHLAKNCLFHRDVLSSFVSPIPFKILYNVHPITCVNCNKHNYSICNGKLTFILDIINAIVINIFVNTQYILRQIPKIQLLTKQTYTSGLDWRSLTRSPKCLWVYFHTQSWN